MTRGRGHQPAGIASQRAVVAGAAAGLFVTARASLPDSGSGVSQIQRDRRIGYGCRDVDSHGF